MVAYAATNKLTRRHFYTLDGIRGVAALLVVMRHVPFFFHDFAESYLAVDIFFLISGFVVCKSYESRLKEGMLPDHFMYVRVVRLYPLYILGTAIGIIASLFGGTHYGYLQGIRLALIASIMFPAFDFGVDGFPFDNPAWSLFLELAINAAYALALPFLSRSVLAGVLLLSLIGLMGALCVGQRHNLDVGYLRNDFIWGFFRVGYSFTAGVLISRMLWTQHPHVRFSGSLIPWGIVASTVYLLCLRPTPAMVPYYDLAVVTFVFPAVVSLAIASEPLGLTRKVFEFFGRISYAIYVLHAPLGALVRSLIGNDALVARLTPLPGVLFFAVLIPVCWFLTIRYDAPIRKRLRWRFTQPK